MLERVWPPPFVHRALTFSFGAVGLLTAVWVARQLSGWRRWLFGALFGPLLVGVGLCGFYDVVWVALALWATFRDSARLAALSFLVHFRGIAVLPVMLSKRLGVVAGLAVALHLALAAYISQHLGEFPLQSPLHWSRPIAWWFPPTTLVVIALTWRDRLAWSLSMPALLLFVDRQAAFWHLLVLAPVAARSLQVGTVRTVALVLGWCTVTSQAFIDSWVPFPIFWLTLR